MSFSSIPRLIAHQFSLKVANRYLMCCWIMTIYKPVNK